MSVILCPTPVLETERFVLRAPAARDYDGWRAFFMADRSRWIRSMATPDEATTWRAWAGLIGHWVLRGWGSFVITTHDSDRALGIVGPWAPINWPEFEIGWSCWSEAHEGTGMMTETAQACLAHAFSTLGWSTAVSYIDAGNTRSIRLAEKLGAVLDPAAPFPGEDPVLVYRHPKPEGIA